MHAVVSGRAGVALLFEGERLLTIGLDPLAPPVQRTLRDVRFLLGDVRDVVFMEDGDLAAIQRRLADARDGDDALQLALFLLDADLSDGAKDEAAGALEELLVRGPVVRFVEGVLHAHPIPATADLAGALRSAKRAKAPEVERLFVALGELQPAIEDVWRAWEGLPPSLFSDEDDRARVRAGMVRAGFFSALARATHAGKSVDEVAVPALAAQEVWAITRHQVVVQAWLAPLRGPVSQFTGQSAAEIDDDVESEGGPPRALHGAEVLERVHARQYPIVGALRARDFMLARERIDELVAYQRTTGEPRHVAKSLCYLATEAQKLGLYELQGELTERATRECPNDVWSWSQRGRALQNLGDLAGALEAYDRAQVFGGDAVAKTGRAEVLKAMGRLDDALRSYEEAVREHPENVVAKNGRAEVLKAMGRLDDALRSYEEVVRDHPENVVTKTGHAEVLKAMGRFDEALRAYEEVVREHPEDVVAKTGRAGILAALGKSREALRALPQGRPTTLDEWIGYHVRGMILLRTGKVDEAVRIFEDGRQNDPSVLGRDYFRTALAVARLRQRQYAAAVEVLDSVVQPRAQPQADLLRVHALGEQGLFSEASAAYLRLPPPPSSQVRELMEELRRRFVDRLPPANDNEWLIRREIDACLLAA